MYRIIDGVKTPYNVLSAREAMELSLNDAEREEFCEIIDCIHEKSLGNETVYMWYYHPKRRWYERNKVDDDNIIALLKYYGYSITKSHVKVEDDLYVYTIRWDTWED